MTKMLCNTLFIYTLYKIVIFHGRIDHKIRIIQSKKTMQANSNTRYWVPIIISNLHNDVYISCLHSTINSFHAVDR